MPDGRRLSPAGVVGVPKAHGRRKPSGDSRDARPDAGRAARAGTRPPGGAGPDAAGPLSGLHPLRRRASSPRDHSRARDLAPVPLAGRAVHGNRSNRHRRHPGDRRPAPRARHRHPHHRPQRAGDSGHHRPRVHPLRRQDPGGGHRHRDRSQPRRPGNLPGRAVRALGEAKTPMAMEARLSLRQSQRVVMTPLLQQAIQLLQLSTLELQDVVQKELLENPLLEEVTPDTPETTDAPVTPDSPPAPTVEQVTEAPPTTERQTDDLPFDFNAVMSADDDHEERSLVSQEDREDLPFENVVRTHLSLADHLEEQLRYASEDAAVRRIGGQIIGNLDEDGYLRAELEEIAQRCGATAEEVARVLELVQGFDPPGVAARSIQECLLLQLKRDPLPDPVSVEIIETYFDDLSRRRYQDIARAMKLPVDRIMESVEEIMGLEPMPGRRFGGNHSRYIVPDVFVYKLGNDYTIVLNEDGIPRLRVNSLYRSLLRGAGSGDEAKQYVEQKLRSALWLIKSVDQRQRTLRKVTQSIVKFQREFLDRGLPHLRPLSLRDVGEDIGMHESTISRVTTNKYVETPQGLFELKFFFHSGIASGDGEMVSSVSVKKMIQDILAAEDQAKPQSDQEVAQALQKRGLTIARRTVAKYREELGILPSHQRRLAPRRR